MEIVKLLRKTYSGEEYLVKDSEKSFKRLKIVDKKICVPEDLLVININALSKLSDVILPESFSYNNENLELIYPFGDEKTLDLNKLDDPSKDHLSYILLEFAKRVFQIYNYKLPFFSLEDVYVTKDNDFKIFPPVFIDPEKLNINNNNANIYIAPEFKNNKFTTPESILYVIGKVIYDINPSEDLKNRIKNLLNEDFKKRTFDFDLSSSIEIFTKEKLLIPILKRNEEKILESYIEDKDIKMIGIVGSKRIGKTTFLDNIQSKYNHSGFLVLRAYSLENFILNLLSYYRNSDNFDSEIYYSLFNCVLDKECKIETMLSYVAKIINAFKNTIIIVDNYNEIKEDFKTLLSNLKALNFKNRFLIIAASTYHFYVFDKVVELEPFNLDKLEDLIKKMLGRIENEKELVNFIFDLSKGIPGLAIEILRLLIEKNILEKKEEKSSWYFKKEITNKLGFENLFNIFEGFSKDELEKFKFLSILSEKFTETDLKVLEMSINSSFSDSLKRLRFKGFIYKEYHTYRFTLKEYWEKLYYSLSENKRREMHLKLINAFNFVNIYEDDLILKQAWHYTMIGEYIKAICLYLNLIKKGLENYYSPSYLLNLINEAEMLMSYKRYSYALLRFKAELYYRLNKKIDFEIPNKKIFEYWKVSLDFIDKKYEEVINYFEKDKSRLIGYGKIGTYRRKLLYYSALYEKEKMEKIKIKDLKEIFNSINAFSSFVNDVKVRAAILLSRVLVYRDIRFALEYLNHAKELAKKYKLLHFLPLIYSEIAHLTENTVIANTYYDKSIQASYECAIPSLSIDAKLNKIRLLLYMGETKEFFAQLFKIREELELKNLKHHLANSYILEALFYAYDRDFQKGFEAINKAKEIQETLGTSQTYLRTLILLYLFCDKKDKAREIYEENKNKSFIKTLDFDLFAELVLSKKDDLKEKWEKFKNSTTFLWREEAYALVGEKIAAVDPDSYFEQLKILESNYATQNLRLSLSLVYEGFSKYYKVLNKKYRFKNYLSKAFSLYNDLNFNNYSIILKNNNEFLAEKFERIKTLEKDLKSERIPHEFIKIAEKYNFVMRILEELKAIEVIEDPYYILNYFAGKLFDNFPIEEVALYLYDERSQREFLFSTLEDASVMNLKEDVLNSSPLLIKISDKIDRFLSYTIIMKNKSLNLNEKKFNDLIEEFELVEYAFVTVMKGIFAKLRSLIDPLTKLYTRYYFNEKLNEIFDKSKTFKTDFSIIMSDIDHFKMLNDKYGHLLGDEVLKEISKIFLKLLRKEDIVGRFGGEEFIIILPTANSEVAFTVAERLRKEIERIDKFPQKITMSFGVASYPEVKAKTPEELIGFADDALYKAKELGRNRVIVFGKDF